MHPLDSYFRDSLTADLSDAGRAIAAPESDRSAWWWSLFGAQAASRHLDFVARELQQVGRGFYTIGSAGHESNAMVAMAARPSDPAGASALAVAAGATDAGRARTGSWGGRDQRPNDLDGEPADRAVVGLDVAPDDAVNLLILADNRQD